jgi:multidrug efflux pump subunit AcrB
VDLSGGVEREVRVDVDPQRLRYFKLGLQDVIDAISLGNVTLPGGDVRIGSYEYQVRVPGELEAVGEIGGLVLNVAAPSPVYVRDVANVSFGIRDRASISRLRGRESVSLSVKKRSGENIIHIADEVKARLESIRPTLPPSTEIAIMIDESEIIRDMVRDLENGPDELDSGWRRDSVLDADQLHRPLGRRHYAEHGRPLLAHPGAGHVGRQCHRHRREHLSPSP